MATGSLDDVALAVSRRIEQFGRAAKLARFSGIVRDTRVDTGRMRGNWQTTVAAPASGTVDRLDPTGAQTIAEIAARVTADKADYLTNNLDYVAHWEDEDGMVARNAARIAGIVDRLANDLRE